MRIPESRQLLQQVLFSYANDLLKADGPAAALEFIEASENRDSRISGAYQFTQYYVTDDHYPEVLDWYTRQTDPKMNHAKEKIAMRIAGGLLRKGIDFSDLPASIGAGLIGDSLQRA